VSPIRSSEENEEELARVQARSRKYQRELEDLTEANDTLTKENQSLRSRARRNEPVKPSRHGAYASGRADVDLLRTGSNEAMTATDGSAGSRDGSVAGDGSNAPTNGQLP